MSEFAPTTPTGAPAVRASDGDEQARRAALEQLAGGSLPTLWVLRQTAVRALAPFDLTPVKGLILGTTAARPCTPGQLAEWLETAPSAISALLADLERRGLIRRETDPNDRRRVRIAASEAGHAMARRMHEAWIGAMDEILKDLSDEELAVLARMQGRVAARVGEAAEPTIDPHSEPAHEP